MPAVTDGSEAVVILRAALTVIDKALVAVTEALSVTRTVKLVPAAVGVPEITPVEAARVNPVGREPTLIDQV